MGDVNRSGLIKEKTMKFIQTSSRFYINSKHFQEISKAIAKHIKVGEPAQQTRLQALDTITSFLAINNWVISTYKNENLICPDICGIEYTLFKKDSEEFHIFEPLELFIPFVDKGSYIEVFTVKDKFTFRAVFTGKRIVSSLPRWDDPLNIK